jgi:preprotein translocase subunit YajC
MPQRRRSRLHKEMQHELVVGDEIITAGGIHAVVREVGEDELKVEIAPNVLVTLDRRAVAAVAHEEAAPEEPAPDEQMPDKLAPETPPEAS